jgi:hypothetical protein
LANSVSILEANRSMKIHTDAASRLAAEVVTQLPVPSRLGLLRFERLNEASWALLYLDPACEQQMGVAASELCSLTESPYASLMEPSVRHRLHEQIQQQLVHENHYRVSYCLHCPTGTLEVIEVGEQSHRYGRELLVGYLIAGRQADLQLAIEAESAGQPASLDGSLATPELDQLLRSRAQQALIVRLARHRYCSSNPQLEAAQLITQAAVEAFDGGERRSGISTAAGPKPLRPSCARMTVSNTPPMSICRPAPVISTHCITAARWKPAMSPTTPASKN